MRTIWLQYRLSLVADATNVRLSLFFSDSTFEILDVKCKIRGSDQKARSRKSDNELLTVRS